MDPYHVYLDLDIVNNDVSSGTAPPICRFSETRSTPILDGNTSDYFVSIIRFNIQTGSSLPVFIPRIETGQDDINKTVYKITLKRGNVSVTQSVMYTPTNLTATLPAKPTVTQDLSSSYYYIYNYQDFISIINDTFATAFENLLTAVRAAGSELPSNSISPYIVFDPQTCKFTLAAM